MTTTETFREMLRRQPVLAAPMCGISDYAYRAICRRMGAELTYTQMVSAVGLSRNDAKTVKILDLEPGEPMVAMQVFGGEPEGMAEAGRMLQDLGAVVVDINMGCPARKITTGLAGSALLRDLARVGRIFRAMRAAVSVPLTVKMRWDWDEDRGAALEAARMAEAEGLDGICLHARTREQGYSGQADWDLIGRVREAAGSLPVIGNGDIRQPSDALAMMRASGCDAVMIGRGVIGDPWLLAECLDAVRRGEASDRRSGPSWADRRALMLLHAGMMVERLGSHGMIPFRKHAAAYLRGVPGVKAMRERLVRVATMEELEAALPLAIREACVG